MTIDLNLQSTAAQGASERSREMGTLIHDTVEQFRREHPDVSPREIEDAMRLALGSCTGGESADAPLSSTITRGWTAGQVAMVILAIFAVLAMFGALLLIRRP